MSFTICAPQLSVSPRASLGGAVTDREILYGLAERGHRIELLVPEGEECPPHPNVSVTSIPRNWLLGHSYSVNLFFLKAVKELLERRKIDVLRIHSPYSVGIGMSWMRFRKKIKTWFSYLHLEGRWDWVFIDKVLPRFADGITCLSEDTKMELTHRFGQEIERIVQVTPLGVDTERFRPEAPCRISLPPHLRKGKGIVLYVGSLIPRKGIKTLLRAWRLIRRECKEAVLIVVGRGPLEKTLLRESEGSNLFHVPFADWETLPGIYAACDILLFPTRKEGFGLVVAEALSSGLPVVTTKALGVRKLVREGETGFCFDVGDVTGISRGVSTLLKNPVLAREMGQRARRYAVESLSWRRCLDATEEFLTRLVGGRG